MGLEERLSVHSKTIKESEQFSLKHLATTLCPRCLNPFYMVSYYMKWDNTSWTGIFIDTAPMLAGRCSEIWLVEGGEGPNFPSPFTGSSNTNKKE